MKYLVWHIYHLICSREFWEEYVFYICYVALVGFIVQVMILDVEMHDYFAVLGLQMISIVGSAILFVSLKSHYQPSRHTTKVLYFLAANGPWLGMMYYWVNGMILSDVMIYGGLMIVVASVEWYFYDNLFDRCCDWSYRLKTLYYKHRHKKN